MWCSVLSAQLAVIFAVALCACQTNKLSIIDSTGFDSTGSVLISPVPHQMMSYMNVGTLSRTELQLLNQLHCRRKRRHRTIFTDEQLEALENLFQETKYPDVGTREQLARKVHLREEKVEVSSKAIRLNLKKLCKQCKLNPLNGSKPLWRHNCQIQNAFNLGNKVGF